MNATSNTAEAHDAIALATTLAGATGAALWLVGVYATVLLPVPGVSDRATLHDQARAALRRDQEQLADEVDLLVVGSRRWGRVARIVLGSVGEGLMADSGCSVIVVPRPVREGAGDA